MNIAAKFIGERLKKNDSRICVLEGESGILASFVHLYPVFTSVGMKKNWLLNDLFVRKELWKKRIAKELIERSKKLASKTNIAKLLLES